MARTIKVKAQRNTSKVTKAMVRQMIEAGREIKFFNNPFALTTTASPVLSTISQPIIQGITGNQRIGDDIEIRRMLMKFRVDINQANTVLSNVVRMVIFSDFQADSQNPIAADLFTGTLVTSLYSEQVIKSHRFKIHYDHLFTLSLNGPSVEIVEKDMKLRHKINYTDVTNVSTSNGKGAMYMFTWSDASSNFPGINGEIELRYTDA